MNEQLVSGEKLGEVLGVSGRTVKRWIGDNKLPYYRFGRTVRFDLQRILDRSLVDPSDTQRER